MGTQTDKHCHLKATDKLIISINVIIMQHLMRHVSVIKPLGNQASIPPLFYRPGALPAAQPTASKH